MPRNGTNWGSRTFLREMTPPRSTAPASRRPQFNHQDTEPVPLRGTLDRILLRPEQTGWAVLYPPQVGSPTQPFGVVRMNLLSCHPLRSYRFSAEATAMI